MRYVDPSNWPIWFPIVWVAFFIGLSIVVRQRRGKPIFTAAPAGALFAERGASGGMASRCLLVAVTNDTLIVSPTFPFNLMFLPEIYGLERNVPVRSIRRVERLQGWLGSNAIVEWGSDARQLRLTLRNPDAFVATLNGLRSSKRRA